MNNYDRKARWKILLILFAIIIITATLLYTNRLAKNLAGEETRKVEQIADVYEYIATANDMQDYGFFVHLIQSNKTIPIISTDEKGNILAYLNIDSAKVASNPDYLQKELKEMKDFAKPIALKISENQYQYIYYKHSALYTQLVYYPYFQLLVIAVFLGGAYVLFNTARKSEQNLVWVGMAKETAHQLGTPISSLSAWIDYLRESENPGGKKNIIDEMDNDVKRLELIADRFSKVGSLPDLTDKDLIVELQNTIDYIMRRASKKVVFDFVHADESIIVKINTTLFNWVVENVLKNALDAMEGTGHIGVLVTQDAKNVFIDISDSGKGISKSRYKTVFEPGFSTKKRGWGLGLTLSKRIVENYHNGKIFVKNSVIGKGTTFRIMLPKTAQG